MEKYKLMFIHGAGGTKRKWREIEDYFQQQVEFIDLPGHGDNEYNLITSIQDHAAYINESIQEDTILVGHSMGGLIALELAARNKHVKGIALVASLYELPVHEKILEKLANGEFPSSLFYASYSKEVNERFLEEEKAEMNLVPIGVTYADFMACNQYSNGAARLSSFHIPVCAILGKQDRLLPSEPTKLLKEIKPNIKIVEIDGSGHYIMLEKPVELYKALIEFIQEVQHQTV